MKRGYGPSPAKKSLFSKNKKGKDDQGKARERERERDPLRQRDTKSAITRGFIEIRLPQKKGRPAKREGELAISIALPAEILLP